MKTSQRIIAFILCIAMAVVLSACGKKKIAIEKSKSIYIGLQSAYNTINDLAEGYKSINNINENTKIDKIIDELPFTEEEIAQAAKNILAHTGTYTSKEAASWENRQAIMTYLAILYLSGMDFSGMMFCLVTEIYENKGSFDEIDVYMDELDKEIYAFSKEYPDFEYNVDFSELYNSLEEYCAYIDSFADLLDDATFDDYDDCAERIESYKNECDLAFEKLSGLYS